MLRQQTFERIYRRNTWRGEETPAGPGSSLGATVLLRTELPKLLKRLNAQVLLDAGCNEALWVPDDLPCDYIGVDIVPEAIAAAKERHPAYTFGVLDIVTDELPTADTAILRDVMQHLSYAEGDAVLKNLKRAGVRHLIASSHVGDRNRNIASGGWYPINMQAPPWGFPNPEWRLSDGAWADREPWPHKILGCWFLT